MDDSGLDTPPPPSGDDMTMRDTRLWLRLGSCAIAVFFFFIFIVSPYRRWQTNPTVRFVLTAVAAMAGTIFTQLVGMLLSYDDVSQLYLVWVVFLSVANESTAAATAYSVCEEISTMIAFESVVFTNNLYVAFYIGFFHNNDKFHYPLWALWAFTMAKMFQRVIGYRDASRAYGPENVNLVAHLTSKDPDGKPSLDTTVDPCSTVTTPATQESYYYNYRIRGDDKVKYRYDEGTLTNLALVETKHKKKVVTIDRIWNCKGNLLKGDGSIATRLKDTCLSFALFKLLRRRFGDYPAEDEGERNKAKRLVLEKLLAEDEKDIDPVAMDNVLKSYCSRTFRVIQVELEFLHDLFYTKYPISFYRGISVLNILQLLIIVSSIWTATWALQKYNESDGTAKTWGKNSTDYALTVFFTVMIIAMELWEFSNHVLSNWSKVLFTCNYVRHCHSRDSFHLDKVLRVLSWGTLWRPLSTNMGQYSLLDGYKPYWKQSFRPPVKVTRDVQFAIFQTLRNHKCSISNGIRALERHEVHGLLSHSCKEDKFDRKILVWHIATSFFELEMSNKKEMTQDAQVAICLSRYCAYLLLFAPALLPVNDLVSELMIQNVVSLAKEFSKGSKRVHEMMKEYHVNDKNEDGTSKHNNLEGTVMAEGLDVAEKLKSSIDDEQKRWKVLADFWAEFILFLAPSDNARAHLEKLSKGGEFITHLWVLLYNAGIRDRPALESYVV